MISIENWQLPAFQKMRLLIYVPKQEHLAAERLDKSMSKWLFVKSSTYL